MCGRFTSSAPGDIVAQTFGLSDVPVLVPRYNLAPTQDVPVIRRRDGTSKLDLLRWGLIPAWAKDATIGSRLINARAETAAEKPAFRAAFGQRRCIIVATGFYEWARTRGGKQPWLIRFRDGRPFALAGLWEAWHGRDGILETCTIITTEPNAVVAPLHDRMPVILAPEAVPGWLDPATQDPGVLRRWLVPFPADDLTSHPVSPRVNNPGNDDPSLVAAVA